MLDNKKRLRHKLLFKFKQLENNMLGRDKFDLINLDISSEIFASILSYLDRVNFDRVSRVCHLFYNITHSKNQINSEKLFSSFCAKYEKKQNAIKKLPGNFFAIGSWDGTIKIWNYALGKLANTLPSYEASEDSIVLCLEYLGNNKIISSTLDDKLHLHIQNYITGQEKQKIDVPSRVNDIRNLSNNELALACDDGAIRILDLESASCTNTLQGGHVRYVKCIAQLSQNEIASCGIEGNICIWDYKTDTLLRKLAKPSENSGWAYKVIDLGNDEIGVCYDDAFRVWNYKNGECLKTIAIECGKYDNSQLMAPQYKKRSNEIRCFSALKLSTDRVICAYGDGTMRVWNYKTGNCIQVISPFNYKDTILYTQQNLNVCEEEATKNLSSINLKM